MFTLPVGINYEGGKITDYAEQCPLCLGYVNAQIAMDAPFHNQIADEAVRNVGRSEKSMSGYSETKMISDIDSLMQIIKTFLVVKGGASQTEPLTIIQIARGRSATDTISLITPLLEGNCISRYNITTGYKTGCYFQYPTEPFVLLNIGMFGRLTQVDTITPGSVFNPTYSFDLVPSEDGTDSISGPTVDATRVSTHCVAMRSTVPRTHISSKNLLHNSAFPSLILLGIDDSMPFVTPAVYDKGDMYRLVSTVAALIN